MANKASTVIILIYFLLAEQAERGWWMELVNGQWTNEMNSTAARGAAAHNPPTLINQSNAATTPFHFSKRNSIPLFAWFELIYWVVGRERVN